MGEKSRGSRRQPAAPELEEPAICRLCRAAAPLQDSHILPDFLFRRLDVFDEKHRMLALQVPGMDPRALQQAAPTERLLCRRCERRFAELERYASRVIFHGRQTIEERPGLGLVVRGVDYARWRLFTLSLLWRMHATRLPAFAAVALGTTHGESVRAMLLADDPGPPERYPCALAVFADDPVALHRVVRVPERRRLGGRRAYVLVTGGLLWWWIIDSAVPAAWLGRSRFAADGGLPIALLPAGSGAALVDEIRRTIEATMTTR